LESRSEKNFDRPQSLTQPQIAEGSCPAPRSCRGSAPYYFRWWRRQLPKAKQRKRIWPRSRSRAAPRSLWNRHGQVALFGINRPQIQNRIDPVTFRGLATAYYDYDHDPSLRAAVLFGHGEHFSRGIDVDAFKSLVATQQPWIPAEKTIDPLAKRQPFLSKPLVVAVHGDTWNMADELFLVADIRVAAADTNFGQDENTHGRFPGGGSTIRFVREAGWANAMRYILTGDHWTAAEAHRMGTVQEVQPTPDAALQRDRARRQIADCGPLGIKTSLASAHLAVDPTEAAALAQLDAQFGALFHTRDFQEGRDAEAEDRRPVYEGR
jgi:enoyl-CoA hydratase